MTPVWAVAGALLAILVLALGLLVLRLLDAVRSLHGSVRALQQSPSRTAPAERRAPSSILLLLEPSISDHRRLVADIRANAGAAVSVPLRVRVADTPAGHALVAGLPLTVEFEQRTQPMTADAPSVLVLDSAGRVVNGGTPSSLADLRGLLHPVGAAARPA